MSDRRTVVKFDNVGKMYKIFDSRGDNLLDALGLVRFVPHRRNRFKEFWALRGIDLELKQGQRLGIIGRNGAGKSTLLKLITENLTPTEGRIAVNGDVQALLEIGGGLHQEFTGYENIQAALVHLGLSPSEIEEAGAEIAEFTELGSFLDQPFKTYSLGMQARLSFGIGTTVKPEILIIDEILGAGDAYFFGKSSARMQQLIEGGAAVILVSHGLDQIVRFCDEAIWIDRGRVAMRGPSVEVVKAYEKFIREFEDRRLLAKNRKAASARYDGFEREGYTDYLTTRVQTVSGIDVSEVTLLVDGVRDDGVGVGAPQDGDSAASAYVALSHGSWSGPLQDPSGHAFYRSLAASASGDAVFNLWFFYPDREYAVDVRYRGSGGTLSLGRSGRLDSTMELAESEEWTTARLVFAERDEEWEWQGGGRRALLEERRAQHEAQTEATVDDRPEIEASAYEEAAAKQAPARDAPEADAEPQPARRQTGGRSQRISRWPGEGSILIEDVAFVDEDNEEQAVFPAGSPLSIFVRGRAHRSDVFPVQPVAAVFRLDGILVSNLIGEVFEVTLADGEAIDLALDLDELNLADGRYVVSVALYRELSPTGLSVAYDLLDRSYEFEVVGNHPLDNGVFRHPGAWALRARPSSVPR